MGLTLEGGNRTSRIAARIVPQMARSLRGRHRDTGSCPRRHPLSLLSGNLQRGYPQRLIRRH